MDYLTKKLYIPLIMVGLSIGTTSCLEPKNIDKAYDWCHNKKPNQKIRTTEGYITCKEITTLFESGE